MFQVPFSRTAQNRSQKTFCGTIKIVQSRLQDQPITTSFKEVKSYIISIFRVI